jgi:Tfp pilus assembly protein PilO
MSAGECREAPAGNMGKSRRKTLVRIVEGVAVGLVLLDVVLYFALVRPLRSMRTAEEVRYSATREHVQELKVRAARLEKFQTAVPETEDQLRAFIRSHIPPRRQGFSRAARLVRRLTEQAGVELSGVAYKLDSAADDPLERLGIEVEVEGPFPSLLNFSHALETASDFIVVREFAFEPAEGRGVALRLGADLYLTP